MESPFMAAGHVVGVECADLLVPAGFQGAAGDDAESGKEDERNGERSGAEEHGGRS